MLEHAETHLSRTSGEQQFLDIHINDDDLELQQIAADRGYKRTDGCDQMAQLDPSAAPTPVPLPDGFRLCSLAESNDLRKIDRCLWRGFNHEGEPPDDGPEEREFMQSAPGFRKDLNIVVEAPVGSFVSYCGMWYEPTNAIAYVEPVATDPDYRGLGLGRACVLEGVRRCGRLGAVQACVGSTIPFYLALGFKPAYRIFLWHREWPLKPNKLAGGDA
jgi:GNAT superfamily N-acetyltransferase